LLPWYCPQQGQVPRSLSLSEALPPLSPFTSPFDWLFEGSCPLGGLEGALFEGSCPLGGLEGALFEGSCPLGGFEEVLLKGSCPLGGLDGLELEKIKLSISMSAAQHNTKKMGTTIIIAIKIYLHIARISIHKI